MFECRLEAVRGPIGKGKATAHVGEELAARGRLNIAVERMQAFPSAAERRGGAMIGTADGVAISITGSVATCPSAWSPTTSSRP